MSQSVEDATDAIQSDRANQLRSLHHQTSQAKTDLVGAAIALFSSSDATASDATASDTTATGAASVASTLTTIASASGTSARALTRCVIHALLIHALLISSPRWRRSATFGQLPFPKEQSEVIHAKHFGKMRLQAGTLLSFVSWLMLETGWLAPDAGTPFSNAPF